MPKKPETPKWSPAQVLVSQLAARAAAVIEAAFLGVEPTPLVVSVALWRGRFILAKLRPLTEW